MPTLKVCLRLRARFQSQKTAFIIDHSGTRVFGHSGTCQVLLLATSPPLTCSKAICFAALPLLTCYIHGLTHSLRSLWNGLNSIVCIHTGNAKHGNDRDICCYWEHAPKTLELRKLAPQKSNFLRPHFLPHFTQN